jgi:hypothetical protein
MKPITFILVSLFFSMASGQAVLPAFTPDAQVLDMVSTLGANEGKFLPNFTCTDVYNGDGLAVFSSFATSGPGIRDYCRKWVYADSRERALYCGGNHGSPHRYNDMWEYDLASNTWVMLHKPDAGASPVHTWWGFTYDQKRDLAYWMCVAGPWLSGTPPLMVYDPYAQSGWTIKSHSSGTPNIRSQGSQFEYLPDKDLCVWYDKQWNGSGMLTWEADGNTWTQLLTQSYTYHNCDSCPGQEAVTNYDSLENALISMRGANVYRYNFGENDWHHVNSGPFTAADNGSGYAYDPDNGIHLLMDDRQVFAYRASDNTVEVKNPIGLDTLVAVINSHWNGNREYMLFYHRALKVFVVYLEGWRSMWVYKYGASTPLEAGVTVVRAVDVDVTPNPFHGTVRIVLNGVIAGDVETLRPGVDNRGRTGRNVSTIRPQMSIYDIHGKLIAKFGSEIRSTIEWNASGLPAGVYILKTDLNNRRVTKRLILTK